MIRTVICEHLVIGSGPGGSVTAAHLAERGQDVLLVEEGPHLEIDSAPNYSIEEMAQKYRNGGLNSTLGKTNITYLEGRCVGGGSEINAALYHRPRWSTLRDWELRFQIDDFTPAHLEPHFEAVEAEQAVSTHPGGVGPASALLKRGADRLGWKTGEIPRFWKYQKGEAGPKAGRRQSMTQTLIPRLLKAGGMLLSETSIDRIYFHGGKAVYAEGTTKREDGQGREPIHIKFKTLFVCCGAVQTPRLLRRSGLKSNIGDGLRLHPMVRIAARFKEEFNDPTWGVPVNQVEAFKPNITLGCSHSSLPHLALWLEGEERAEYLREWKKMGIFYVAVVGEGLGRVRNIPLINEPLVRFSMTQGDMALLGEGLNRLGQLLLEAGAQTLFNPIPGRPAIKSAADLASLRTDIPQGVMNVSTIHLFSSCPMGEDKSRCAVNSFGRVHGLSNTYINDASILPLSPAVNPQGTLMAVARRNILHYLDTCL